MFDENGFNLDVAQERIELNMSAADLLTLHGQLCLALRHPSNRDQAAERAHRLVTRFEEILLDVGMISKEGLYLIRTTEAKAMADVHSKAT